MERTKFEEAYSLNVKDKTESKNGLSYLSWAWAWAEFKKIYEDATYKVLRNENGQPYIYDEKLGYMVFTEVTADGVTHEMWLPVMDGANKSMKNKPYNYTTRYGEKTVEQASMFDINKTLMRCLTKNLAMFGLGLYIYAGEDLPEDEKKEVKQATPIDNRKVDIVKLCKQLGFSGVETEKSYNMFIFTTIGEVLKEENYDKIITKLTNKLK